MWQSLILLFLRHIQTLSDTFFHAAAKNQKKVIMMFDLFMYTKRMII